jgi:hypothetical protein
MGLRFRDGRLLKGPHRDSLIELARSCRLDVRSCDIRYVYIAGYADEILTALRKKRNGFALTLSAIKWTRSNNLTRA